MSLISQTVLEMPNVMQNSEITVTIDELVSNLFCKQGRRHEVLIMGRRIQVRQTHLPPYSKLSSVLGH